MGPRSRDRGITSAGVPTRENAKLQWGRDHVIAEFKRPVLMLPHSTHLLQWGRDHVIAELSCPERNRWALWGFNGAAIT